jgi:hypothetical protein
MIILGLFNYSITLPGQVNIPHVSKEDRICFALYTVHNHILKLTAQLYPLDNHEDITVSLEVLLKNKWVTIAKTLIIYPGFTAPFRVEDWDPSQDVKYRVNHRNVSFYEGIIKKDPVDKNVIVVAAFTGNSIYPGHGGDIPRKDIVKNLIKIKPDLLFFSGDQVYDHSRHLAYWLKFGRDFGDIIGVTPTICIPDDHDVGQYNLWGMAGKKSDSRAGNDGGYYMPVEYIKEVERAQTSHLPDPYDPTPVSRGIGVYYTSLNWGRVSFAIIEDRKFKTGPKGKIPLLSSRWDHVTDKNYDPKKLDIPGATLLGERQLNFLREWGKDWTNCDMKAVLSQTIFCGGAHIHGKVGGRLQADLDSNGWPQTGRNKALTEMRRCFAIHIAGDQHLATIFHHGIEDWNDACYSFCVPSIANLYLRWWAPLNKGKNHIPGMPAYTGEFLDGFGNKITCWAAANPSRESNGGNKLSTRAAGFGIVYFNKKTREITMECWPRNIDITAPGAKQYQGWPRTIRQEDNYGRAALAYLPLLNITGIQNPIIQIIDESNNEVVYTLRIKGSQYRPKVFKKGTYSIKIFDKGYNKILRGVHSQSKGLKERKRINVDINKKIK